MKNFLFVFFACIFLFGFLEFVLFRHIMPASDLPSRSVVKSIDDPLRFDYMDKGMFKSGIYRLGFPNIVRARYRVNSDGWSSDKEFSQHKLKNRFRIAIIGDSFVEGLHIDADKSFAEVLEKRLIESGFKNVEVYKFGRSSAHLAQYLLMMRYVKKNYKPDLVIVNINNGDLWASIADNEDRTIMKNFLQFKLDEKKWVEVKPIPYSNPPSSTIAFLKNSSIFRFLLCNLQICDRAYGIKQNSLSFIASILGKVNLYKKTEKTYIENKDVIDSLVHFIFLQYKLLLGSDSKLLLVKDADRDAIYTGENLNLESSITTARIAKQLDIPYLDLTKTFVDDYMSYMQRFDFSNDWHWNERGHFLVGSSIADYLIEQKLVK